MGANIIWTIIIVSAIVVIGFLILIASIYRKAGKGEALVRTGVGGTKVFFSGGLVFPVLHRMERMDITVKTILLSRKGSDGLICKDNMRADIQTTFFVRVNNQAKDVEQVADSIGTERASDPQQLELLFDAKFSEALKTVGKHFEFVELYNSRAQFKDRILEEIGTDLNGYILDDCAIDYLEQTSINDLDENNILDSEGIKKIIELTSEQKMKANEIDREREKVIKKQDVEAKEAILELERQQEEAEAKQRREISVVKSREEAESDKIREEERLKAEKARIATEEEIQIAEENRLRQVAVAAKNKERTEAVEEERVQQAQQLEETERLRVVELATIEKEKALEVERKNIQDVIRDRVAVEKAVVEEQERINDTKAFAEAERQRKVKLVAAERDADAALVAEIKDAEAKKQAAEHAAKQRIIESEAEQQSSGMRADAIKTLAEAEAAEKAALGMAEAQVREAKAMAREKEGEAEASAVEDLSLAEAKGIEAKAEAQAGAEDQLGLVRAKVAREQGKADAEVIDVKADAMEKQGLMEAKVLEQKGIAEAKGIAEKAKAMTELDGVGKEHEEFKLKLEARKEIELARIEVQKEIAASQALVIAEAMKSANIDIVGGETMFFEQIMGSITQGKKLDRMVNNSEVMTQVKDTFFGTQNGDNFKERLQGFIDQFGVSGKDLRELSLTALLMKLAGKTEDEEQKGILGNLRTIATTLGIGGKTAEELGLI
ncbi:MAG: flotillin family protein [Bacteroidota bacterium]